MERSLRKIGEDLLPAIAYGDAAGLPVETKSHAEIAERFGSIRTLLPIHENPYFVGELGAGTWSDDTQLSLAVTHALVESEFDMKAIADEHAIAYHQTPWVQKDDGRRVKRGWGGSTTKAVERYMDGAPTMECGVEDAAGNGVIMKLAPLAYWLIAHDTPEREAYEMLDRFTSFTHDSTVARVATRVHYDVLQHLSPNGRTIKRLGRFAHARAMLHEAFMREDSHATSRSLSYLTTIQPIDTELILKQTDGKGFFVPQTLAMAYGAFVARGGMFSESVYEAVNLGGDTDSTASIVAAMSVFKWNGISQRPADFTTVQDHGYLSEVSRQLADLVDVPEVWLKHS